MIPNMSRFGKLLSFEKKHATRPFFDWLVTVFNKIDMQRIEEYGPDRVCAEWCLKNGASVQWVDAETILKDYNSLPREGTIKYIKKIDATDSSISHEGFLHLRGCNYIQEIIFKNCVYVENDALKLLSFVKNSLEYLKVVQCGNITEKGLLHIKDLTNLKTLELYQLSYVNDKLNVLQILKEHLPKCNILHDFAVKQKASNVN